MPPIPRIPSCQSVWRSVWWAADPGKTRRVLLGCSRWGRDLPKLPPEKGLSISEEWQKLNCSHIQGDSAHC